MDKRSIGLIFLVLVSVGLALGCVGDGAQTKASAGPVSATWIEPEVADGCCIAIPVQAVDENTNTHFRLNTAVGEMAVMAYRLGDDVIVRSNACPPCGSIGFTLDENVLVCDSCGTTFDAETGLGIQGSCVDYPKESIPYTEDGGNIVMGIGDIATAHMNTVQRG